MVLVERINEATLDERESLRYKSLKLTRSPMGRPPTLTSEREMLQLI
jgi:hypothetical protein